MTKKLPPRLQELMEIESEFNAKIIPIPIGMFDEGIEIDNETAQKHMKLCLGAKIPYVTISNGIPVSGAINNPAESYKTPASFVRSDISWFLDSSEEAKRLAPLLSERLKEFYAVYKYMLAPKKLLDRGNNRFTYNGSGKTYAAVQWCYGNIYARLSSILLLHFMKAVESPEAEALLKEPLDKLLPLTKKRDRS
ncbi:MAG: hypothetical protein IJZ16_08730 [Clostridia bacterium]|nr:hypothetical protein [Clostridia bacterium]